MSYSMFVVNLIFACAAFSMISGTRLSVNEKCDVHLMKVLGDCESPFIGPTSKCSDFIECLKDELICVLKDCPTEEQIKQLTVAAIIKKAEMHDIKCDSKDFSDKIQLDFICKPQEGHVLVNKRVKREDGENDKDKKDKKAAADKKENGGTTTEAHDEDDEETDKNGGASVTPTLMISMILTASCVATVLF